MGRKGFEPLRLSAYGPELGACPALSIRFSRIDGDGES